MSGLEILDGRLGPAGSGPAEPPDAAGVFETAAVAGGRPRFLEEHLARFAGGCAHFGLAAAPGAPVLRAAAGELLRASGVAEGFLRWAAWRSPSGGEGWRMRVGPPRPDGLLPAWRAALAGTRLGDPGPEAPFKHLGRRAWREALARGREAGLEEVILADRGGRVVEGSRSNVFLVLRGRLVTPALAGGPLPGIARAKVLALARSLRPPLAVEERDVGLGELGAAAEAFFTNALVGIRPASALDGRTLPAPGPVAARLLEAWRRAARQQAVEK